MRFFPISEEKIYFPFINENNYQDIRKYLLSRSFFIHHLILNIRETLHIPKEILGDEEKIITWEKENNAYWTIEMIKKIQTWGVKSSSNLLIERFSKEKMGNQKLYEPIYKALEKFSYLELDFNLLKWCVLGFTEVNFYNARLLHNDVYTVTSLYDTIAEPGIYIKYLPNLSDKELLDKKKRAQMYYEKSLTRTMTKTPKKKGDKKLNKLDKLRERIYVTVEQNYVGFYDNLPNEANIKKLLELLSEEMNIDYIFLKNKYYKTQKSFSLPSVTEISKISA